MHLFILAKFVPVLPWDSFPIRSLSKLSELLVSVLSTDHRLSWSHLCLGWLLILLILCKQGTCVWSVHENLLQYFVLRSACEVFSWRWMLDLRPESRMKRTDLCPQKPLWLFRSHWEWQTASEQKSWKFHRISVRIWTCWGADWHGQAGTK